MMFHHQIQWIRISMKTSLTPTQVLRLSQLRNMLVIGLSLILVCFIKIQVIAFGLFPLIYSGFFFAFMSHLGLTLLCAVPPCVEDRTVTPRCFVLNRFDLEMDCCLLDIYLISCLFHMTFINLMHIIIFHYQMYSIRG